MLALGRLRCGLHVGVAMLVEFLGHIKLKCGEQPMLQLSLLAGRSVAHFFSRSFRLETIMTIISMISLVLDAGRSEARAGEGAADDDPAALDGVLGAGAGLAAPYAC